MALQSLCNSSLLSRLPAESIDRSNEIMYILAGVTIKYAVEYLQGYKQKFAKGVRADNEYGYRYPPSSDYLSFCVRRYSLW